MDEQDPEKIINAAFTRVEKLTHARFDNLMEQLSAQSVHIQNLYEVVQIQDATINDLVKTIKFVAANLDMTNSEINALTLFLADKHPDLKQLIMKPKSKTTTKRKPAKKKKTP